MAEPINILPDFAEMIKGCAKGNRKFQALLYQTFCNRMFGVCLRYSQSHQDAEDVLQEGFVRVFANISKFRGEGSFEGWVRRIFVNTAIEFYRKNVKMFPIVEINYKHENKNGDDFIIEKMSADELLKMIQQLSSGYRTVFNLYAVEGYTHREIAELMGISEGTSKSQVARARVLLQKMLQDHSKKNSLTVEYAVYGK